MNHTPDQIKAGKDLLQATMKVSLSLVAYRKAFPTEHRFLLDRCFMAAGFALSMKEPDRVTRFLDELAKGEEG